MANNAFDKKFTASQKTKLDQEKTRLEAELSRIGREVAPGDFTASYQDYGSDEESDAAEFAQDESNASVSRQLEDELGRVIRALARIEAGQYGLDIKTGQPISRKRLEAYPAAEADI